MTILTLTIMTWLGRLISRAMLGPVHVHGSDPRSADVDVILVPRSLSPADCWLFWSRLKRPPLFVERGQLSNCWGYRWLGAVGFSVSQPHRGPGVILEERLAAYLNSGRCLVISINGESSVEIANTQQLLRGLHAHHRHLRVQVLTFNYDFRHTLGSPIHWIWRPSAIDMVVEPLRILKELQRLQKLAWSIKGYQTLPQWPLISQSGRVPSSLLLSWHEVRAQRRWRWPKPLVWLWLPLALVSALANALPLLVSYVVSHSTQQWRIERQFSWLGPLYLINHLIVWLVLGQLVGYWAWGYGAIVLMGLQPLGKLADAILLQDDLGTSRSVRERLVNYFD